MSSNLELDTCAFCEHEKDVCDCCTKCPKCHSEMDPLDASICLGCDSYYGDCICPKENKA